MKRLIFTTALLFSMTTLYASTASEQSKGYCSQFFSSTKLNDPWHNCIRISSKLPSPERDFQMGMLLLPIVPDEGRSLLKKAAAHQHREAMFVLAQNDEIINNSESAFFWYEQAAQLEHPLAQFQTAEMLFQGRGVQQNRQLAFRWYWRAAHCGLPQAQYALGQRYEFGEGVIKNCPQSLVWYIKAGEQGYLPAHIRLGDIYYYAQFGHQDYGLAAMWYQRGADLKDPYAAYQYGAMLAGGFGIKQNSKQAFYYLEISANLDYTPAQSLLGRLYYSSGNSKYFGPAYFYLQKAAFKGDELAALTLGKMYRRGSGVPQDFKQAAYYFKIAAQCGNAEGQALLGLSYQQGLGVPKNYRMAAHWYHLAAAQGNMMSQYNLSGLYHTGRGVPKRRVEAYAFANLAAQQNLDEAKEARMLRGNFLTENELYRGQDMALGLE